MKSKMFKLVAIALILIPVLVMVGCGGNNRSDDRIGTGENGNPQPIVTQLTSVQAQSMLLGIDLFSDWNGFETISRTCEMQMGLGPGKYMTVHRAINIHHLQNLRALETISSQDSNLFTRYISDGRLRDWWFGDISQDVLLADEPNTNSSIEGLLFKFELFTQTALDSFVSATKTQFDCGTKL